MRRSRFAFRLPTDSTVYSATAAISDSFGMVCLTPQLFPLLLRDVDLKEEIH